MNRFIIIIFILSAVFPQVSYDQFRCARSNSAVEASVSARRTANQDKVDITHYQLNLEIDPAAQSITGFVVVTGKVLDTTLTAFEYNLHENMIVDSVKDGNTTQNFTHSENIISWSRGGALVPGEIFQHIIFYHGAPAATGFGSFRFDERNGRTLISTLSEPYGARDWWPCKDDPSDKADSVDVVITISDEYIVASNGTLQAVETVDTNVKRWRWQESYPITTYLVSLAIYPYYTWQEEYISPVSGVTMPVQFYVFPEDSTPAIEDFNITTGAIGIFAQLFGEYPFIGEKYGMAAFPWSGAMEHQTCTSYGHNLIRGDHYYDWILVHELAHQWWGDLVTCADFHHIWLNEGFATYSEALWVEQSSGEEAFRQYINSRLEFATWWADPPVYRYDVSNSGEIFHTTVYKKGAWVLHMLRHIVGDSTFFQILQTYASDPSFAFGNATTEEFRDLCETVSGQDLHSFFSQWIYQSFYPTYTLSYTGTDTISVMVTQSTPDGNLFSMPLDFAVELADTTLRFQWLVDEAEEIFTFTIPAGQVVTDVILDPDHWVLKQVDYLQIEDNTLVPQDYGITSVFPNPFNARLSIQVTPVPGKMNEIVIYDVQGRRVWTNRFSPLTGNQTLIWNGKNNAGESLPSGLYWVVLSSGRKVAERKVVLLK